MKSTSNKEINDVAGCLIGKEREFLLDYSSHHYKGVGEMVDLGCFLGSSTFAMAIGLEINNLVTEKSKRIFAYDRFEWNRWMNRPAERYRLSRSYEPNECFVDEFERQMGNKIQYIETVKGDLTTLVWNSKKQIEYLFVDSMKDWQLCNCIIAGFYPAMIPGVSFIHHQDFVFFHTYWIHLTMYRMRAYFESVDHEYMGPSKVFRYVRELPPEILRPIYNIDDFSLDEIDKAFEYSLRVVRQKGHAEIIGAKIHALFEKQEFDAARRLLEEAKRAYPNLLENPVFKNSVNQLEKNIPRAA